MRRAIPAFLFSILLLISPVWAQCPGPYCPGTGGAFPYSPAYPTQPNIPDYSAPPESEEPMSPEVEQQIKQASVIVYSALQQSSVATQYAKGSGTIIKYADSVAIITAGHVVADGSPAYIQTLDGLKVRYRVITYDSTIDYAILEPLSNQEELYQRGTLLFAGEYPRSTYILSGYDGRAVIRIWRARFRRGLFVSRTQYSYWIELDRPATQGDSGGGIFTPNGRLAAIIWGTDGSTTIATTVTPVAEYLLRNQQTCFLWRRPRPALPAPRPDQPSAPSPSRPGPTPPEIQPTPEPNNPELVPVPKPEPKPEQSPPKPESKPEQPEVKKPSLLSQLLDGLAVGLIGFAVYLLVFGVIIAFGMLRSLR